MEIYLIRHTCVAVDRDVCYGNSDVPLADSFETEKNKLAALLPDVLKVYASPLTRCRTLAEVLTPGQVNYDERLKEYHFGNWEMKRWSEIPAEELQPWMDNFTEVCATGGESFGQLSDRVLQFWQQLRQETAPAVAVVAHGAVIRALLAHVLEMPLHKAFTLEISYGSVSMVKVHPEFYRVMYINK